MIYKKKISVENSSFRERNLNLDTIQLKSKIGQIKGSINGKQIEVQKSNHYKMGFYNEIRNSQNRSIKCIFT